VGKSGRPNLDPTAVDELELCFREFAFAFAFAFWVFVRFRRSEKTGRRDCRWRVRPHVSAATGRRRQTTSAYGPSAWSHVHLPILGLACPLALEIALSRVNIKQSAISLSSPLWSFLLSSSTFAPPRSLARSCFCSVTPPLFWLPTYCSCRWRMNKHNGALQFRSRFWIRLQILCFSRCLNRFAQSRVIFSK